jgi:hypothetical protein
MAGGGITEWTGSQPHPFGKSKHHPERTQPTAAG